MKDLDRKRRDVQETSCRPHSVPALDQLSSQDEPFPLPPANQQLKERAKSEVVIVPIDTSGSRFNRMCQYRESIRSSSREYLDDGTARRLRLKVRRRQTISGVPGSVVKELGAVFYNLDPPPAPTIRERPRSLVSVDSYGSKQDKKPKRRNKSLDNLDEDEPGLARSCSLRRSLRSLFKDGSKKSKSTDFWVEGPPSSPGPPVVDLGMPIRRSRSLPRSLRAAKKEAVMAVSQNPTRSVSTEGRLDRHDEENILKLIKVSQKTRTDKEEPQKPKRKGPKEYIKSKLRLSRSRSQQSNLQMSTSAGSGTSLNRPKSMDLQTSRSTSAVNIRHPIHVRSPTVPPSQNSAMSAGMEPSTSGGRHVHINIPDKPWTEPFATVKLRGSRRKPGTWGKEERHSSSGT